nr:CNT_HP1_G0015790.mRNA.1.CDS.1 [Saccharomyces cerevisiae]
MSSVAWTRVGRRLAADEQEKKHMSKLVFPLLPMLAFMYFLRHWIGPILGIAYTSGNQEDWNLR